ncbi:MAG TPA: glycosyl hydrolase family 28 protein [Acidobacteriaceae bacterium]|jgi:polygalacturonase
MPAAAALVGASGLAPSRATAEFAAPQESREDLGARIYNVRRFGAKGDGTTLDTTAVQKAIDTCTADGGGTVLVPAGKFVIGTVELKSNVTLHLAAGSTLLGSGDGKQYHAVDAIPLRGDSTLGDGNWALLFAVNARNVTIEGAGTIDGQGPQFHSQVRGTPPPSGLGGNRRPYHILAYRCERLVVRDIALVDCAYHSIRVIQSKQVHMEQLYIHNRVNGNNDGFHFISAENVTVNNCTVYCQDDACALFGSCKNITVSNSFFSTRWSVFRFGGGTAENITVSNCVLSQVYGCPFKFHGTPGSRFERMSFSNIVLDQVTGPIHISIGPESRRGAQSEEMHAESAAPPPIVRDIAFSNIHGTVTTDPPRQLAESTLTSTANPGERYSCIALNAVHGAVLENISFDNIHLTFGGGGSAEDGARRDLPEIAGEYFMLGPMPAYGFYARNVRGISLNNIRFEVSQPELRPAVVLDNAEDVSIQGLSIQGNTGSESALRFRDTRDVLITAPRLLTPASVFLAVEGTKNGNIAIDGGDVSKAATPLTFKNGAQETAVHRR